MSRNALNYAALVIPVAAVLCAFAGLVVSAQRIARGNEDPIDIVVAAGALAFTGTFVIHGIFSYERHLTFGWMTDAYPRYYLPLAALVPLAGLSLLAAIKQPHARTMLTGFLIASPVAALALVAMLSNTARAHIYLVRCEQGRNAYRLRSDGFCCAPLVEARPS